MNRIVPPLLDVAALENGAVGGVSQKELDAIAAHRQQQRLDGVDVDRNMTTAYWPDGDNIAQFRIEDLDAYLQERAIDLKYEYARATNRRSKAKTALTLSNTCQTVYVVLNSLFTIKNSNKKAVIKKIKYFPLNHQFLKFLYLQPCVFFIFLCFVFI